MDTTQLEKDLKIYPLSTHNYGLTFRILAGPKNIQNDGN